MGLREVIGALVRRWPVWLVGMVLTLGAGWVVIHPTPSYTASEIFAAQPPVTPWSPNSLTDFRPSLAITAALVAQLLKSPSGEALLHSRGLVGTYNLVPRNSGTQQNPAYIIPSVQATVTSADQDQAAASTTILLRAFDEDLKSLQDQWNVPANLRITITVLAPIAVTESVEAKSRALAGVAILGIASCFTIALWWDIAVQRRRRAKADLLES
jgi:hypothetical protein